MISWDIAHQGLPDDRGFYPRAPFATLWTERPDDTEKAWVIYRDRLRNVGRAGDALYEAFGGRPFRVPSIEATHAYAFNWGKSGWSDDERREVANFSFRSDGNLRKNVGLLEWETSRRNWICDELVLYQSAYEMTQSDLKSYRETGEVSCVEIPMDCCKACTERYGGKAAVTSAIEIPVPGCINDHGCTCSLLPLLDKPLGEI